MYLAQEWQGVRSLTGGGSQELLFFFSLWCGCCLIPFFVDDFSVFIHSCPNCKKEVGRYKGAVSMAS